jgi:hypothetical protein
MDAVDGKKGEERRMRRSRDKSPLLATAPLRGEGNAARSTVKPLTERVFNGTV